MGPMCRNQEGKWRQLWQCRQRQSMATLHPGSKSWVQVTQGVRFIWQTEAIFEFLWAYPRWSLLTASPGHSPSLPSQVPLFGLANSAETPYSLVTVWLQVTPAMQTSTLETLAITRWPTCPSSLGCVSRFVWVTQPLMAFSSGMGLPQLGLVDRKTFKP